MFRRLTRRWLHGSYRTALQHLYLKYEMDHYGYDADLAQVPLLRYVQRRSLGAPLARADACAVRLLRHGCGLPDDCLHLERAIRRFQDASDRQSRP